jgi:mono/diheme cytochrome c family protein
VSEHDIQEPIKLYLDDDKEPFKQAVPPLTFQFNTIALSDGPHRLRIEAPNGLAPPTIREIPFIVRNGVAITVSGLDPQQTIAGQVQMVINAYAGNTEVDFEPRRAETPEPIPTWAWVVFLGVVAWTMFYVLNPTLPPRYSEAAHDVPTHEVGHRIFADTCARCHGEEGQGQAPTVPELRDSTKAIAPDPGDLLVKVATGTYVPPPKPFDPDDPDAMGPPPGSERPSMLMPPWGPILTNEEIVGVVNHVRHSWGHDSSQIELRHRVPPEGVTRLEQEFSKGLRNKRYDLIDECCNRGQRKSHYRLYRTDGIDALGAEQVVATWNAYFRMLGEGRVTQIQLIDARYDYDPDTVDAPESVVIGLGRILLATEDEQKKPHQVTGRFIRIYRNYRQDDGSIGWALTFDFADVPMAVGCEPFSCPPPGREPPPRIPDDDPPVQPPAGDLVPSPIGYAEVQAFFRELGKDASTSPHENFWEMPYEAFVGFVFDDFVVGGKVRMITPHDRESNLVRALRDGHGIVVTLPDGSTAERDIDRMPKGAPPMPEERIQAIADWIAAGAPERKGEVRRWDTPRAPDGPARTTDVTYADVQAMFRKLAKDASTSPHENFWERPYEEFVAYVFDDFVAGGKVRMIVPGDSAASNLIRALKDGRGIVVERPDGSTAERDIDRMPKGAPPMPDGDVALIAEWIDAGMPKERGSPPWSGSPRPVPGSAPPGSPAPPGFPAPGVPPPAPPPGFPPPGGEPPAPPPGFPAPGAAPPGFPAPGAAPPAPTGFPSPGPLPPAPAPSPQAPPAPGFPAPQPSPAAPEAGGFPAPAPAPSEGGGFPPPAAAPAEPPAAPPRPGTYPAIQQVLRRTFAAAPPAPYGTFWDLPYDEFIGLGFSDPEEDAVIQLVVPGNANASNLVRWLRDGKGIVLNLADGNTLVKDYARMPWGADPMPDVDIAKIVAWIDAGCPR